MGLGDFINKIAANKHGQDYADALTNKNGQMSLKDRFAQMMYSAAANKQGQNYADALFPKTGERMHSEYSDSIQKQMLQFMIMNKAMQNQAENDFNKWLDIGGQQISNDQLAPKMSSSGKIYMEQPRQNQLIQDIQKEVAQEQVLAPIKTENKIDEKSAIQAFESGSDLVNAELKIDNQFDSFLDTVYKTYKLTGAKPGIMNGALTKILGATKANEFAEGFKGGTVEYAAAVGRIAMPNSRATRLINLFKGTAPSEWSSIASGIQTTVDSYRNAIATDMSRNPELYGFGKTPNRDEKEEMKKQLAEFEEEYKRGLYKKVYKKYPELVEDEYVKKYKLDANSGKLEDGTTFTYKKVGE